MRGVAIESEIRRAAYIHASLLDSFIALTEAELADHDSGFIAESLQELLETLRSERRAYGSVGGVMAVPMAVIENAA